MLVRFAPLLFAQSLPRKRFFGPALLAGLHVEAVLLDFLDDVFLLHFALETAQCIFQRFVLLDDNFRHFLYSPPIRFGLVTCGASRRPYRRRFRKSFVPAPGTNYRIYRPLRGRTVKGSRHLLINSEAPSQGILHFSTGFGGTKPSPLPFLYPSIADIIAPGPLSGSGDHCLSPAALVLSPERR